MWVTDCRVSGTQGPGDPGQSVLPGICTVLKRVTGKQKGVEREQLGRKSVTKADVSKMQHQGVLRKHLTTV